MADVHPTAVVEDGARLGAGVTIGPYAIVGRDVVLGDGVQVDAHAVIRGRTSVGARTKVGPFAAIGGEPQDLSYRGEDTSVEIGPDCLLREHVTVHRGTPRGRSLTRIGARCFLMVASHVAHDCIVADNVILTNAAMVGGHAEIGEYAILGGAAAVQQRCRIGAHSFVGGLVGVTSDIVPFAMALGHRPRLVGINVRGLKRRGFDHQTIKAIRAAQRMFFASGGPRSERIDAVAGAFAGIPAVALFIDFVRASGNRPLALPRSHDEHSDDES